MTKRRYWSASSTRTAPSGLTSYQDECISHQGRSTQFRQVPDHRKRQENDELCENEVSSLDESLAVRHRQNESLKVLGDEDGVGCMNYAQLASVKRIPAYLPATNPIWDTVIEVRMVNLILLP